MFNAETFLHTESDQALETKRIPIPIDQQDTFAGRITDVKFRQAAGKKDVSQTYTFMDVTWELQVPPNILEAIARDKATVKQSLIVDVNAAGTGLDFAKGKNIQLGRVREAIGQNTPGEPWSPTRMMGGAANVKIKHRPDGEDVYDEVDTVTALS